MTFAPTLPRELAWRASGGIEVSLLWVPGDQNCVLSVVDHRTDEAFRTRVAGAEALDAFRHPFTYRPPGAATALARSSAEPCA